jgi:hypothetical protein
MIFKGMSILRGVAKIRISSEKLLRCRTRLSVPTQKAGATVPYATTCCIGSCVILDARDGLIFCKHTICDPWTVLTAPLVMDAQAAHRV